MEANDSRRTDRVLFCRTLFVVGSALDGRPSWQRRSCEGGGGEEEEGAGSSRTGFQLWFSTKAKVRHYRGAIAPKFRGSVVTNSKNTALFVRYFVRRGALHAAPERYGILYGSALSDGLEELCLFAGNAVALNLSHGKRHKGKAIQAEA
jgi:hypothetical protein